LRFCGVGIGVLSGWSLPAGLSIASLQESSLGKRTGKGKGISWLGMG
jgi:hypothetical protein